MAENKAEEQDISARKYNVIVHGVAESESDGSEQRQTEDSCQVTAMLQELNLTNIRVENTIRLGERPQTNRSATFT